MFQAIVHAPAMRPGARLCLSDLRQTVVAPPRRPKVGDRFSLRYGVCCPSLGTGQFTAVEARTALVQIAGSRWRLGRCPNDGGIVLPGLMAEDWIVIAQEPSAAQ